MDAMVTTESRAYRKNLTTSGLIYLGQEEHEVRVINISLSGMLVELKPEASVSSINDIFRALRVSSILDFYLPSMGMSGDAQVVRAYPGEQGMAIAVEFRNLNYEVENQPYMRRAYRKSIATAGKLIIDHVEYAFATVNVSVDGVMVRIGARIEAREGEKVAFSFDKLELEGYAEVMWCERGDEATLLGLKYWRLQNNAIKGVPNFVRD